MFTTLIDIAGDIKVITNATELGYETNIYQIVDDGLVWLERHVINKPGFAIRHHHKMLKELSESQDCVRGGICASCDNETLLVFKKLNGDMYCSLCRDLFIEGCQ